MMESAFVLQISYDEYRRLIEKKSANLEALCRELEARVARLDLETKSFLEREALLRDKLPHGGHGNTRVINELMDGNDPRPEREQIKTLLLEVKNRRTWLAFQADHLPKEGTCRVQSENDLHRLAELVSEECITDNKHYHGGPVALAMPGVRRLGCP